MASANSQLFSFYTIQQAAPCNYRIDSLCSQMDGQKTEKTKGPYSSLSYIIVSSYRMVHEGARSSSSWRAALLNSQRFHLMVFLEFHISASYKYNYISSPSTCCVLYQAFRSIQFELFSLRFERIREKGKEKMIRYNKKYLHGKSEFDFGYV